MRWNLGLYKSSLYWCSFLFLFLLTGCDSSENIVNNLDEREANKIIVFLADHGIDAMKVPVLPSGGGGGLTLWGINVPAANKTEAMALLNNAGLPKRPGKSLLEIFKQGSLVPSDMQEKVRFQTGLAEQIAGTIRKFDGILEADVTVSVPKEDPLNPNASKGKVTAAVYIKHRGVLDDPNNYLETKIRRFVAGAIDGLSFDDVTIIKERVRSNDVNISKERPIIELASIWGITISKESITRFRVIFFSFFIAIWLLFLLSLWMLWKLFPILHKKSGLTRFFSMKPLFTSVKRGDAISEVAEEKAKEPSSSAVKSETKDG